MKHRNRKQLAGLTSSPPLVGALCAVPLALGASEPKTPAPQQPVAILNEVMFDPVGKDGTADLGEYVEIVVLNKDGLDLSTLSLTDNFGNSLGGFPSTWAPPGCAVVLCLGPDSFPYLDSNTDDGSAGFSSGLPTAEYLDNASGGVRLLDSDGVVVDAFYWGQGSAPLGTHLGPWGDGRFFDTSLATGTPVFEGESVGRSAYQTTYPGSPDDWAPHGGEVAAHPSPGRANNLMHAYPEDLLLGAQKLINDTLLGYGDMQNDFGRYSITASSVTGVVVNRPSETTLVVKATHSFTVEKHGVASVYTGQLLTEQIGDPTPDSLSYTRNVSGTLTTPGGDRLYIQNSVTYSGYASGPRRSDYESRFELTEAGQHQWFELSGYTTLTQVTDDQWLFAEKRDGSDYLDPKTRTTVTSNMIDRIADGQTHSFFTMNRPYPSGPTPYTGVPYQETIVLELDTQVEGDGSSNSTVTRFEESRDGALFFALQKGKQGNVSMEYDAYGGQYTGDFDMDLPVRRLSDGQQATASAFMDRTDSFVGNKYVASGVRGYGANGTTIAQNNFYVDPPIVSPACGPAQSGEGVTLVIIIVDANGDPTGEIIIVDITPVPPPPPPPPPPAPAPPAKPMGQKAWEAGAAIVECAGLGATAGAPVPVVGPLAGALIGAPVCGIFKAIKVGIWGW